VRWAVKDSCFITIVGHRALRFHESISQSNGVTRTSIPIFCSCFSPLFGIIFVSFTERHLPLSILHLTFPLRTERDEEGSEINGEPIQIFCLESFFQTPSVYAPHLLSRDQVSHPYKTILQYPRYNFIYWNCCPWNYKLFLFRHRG
jgi:hypothetical protein